MVIGILGRVVEVGNVNKRDSHVNTGAGIQSCVFAGVPIAGQKFLAHPVVIVCFGGSGLAGRNRVPVLFPRESVTP